MRYRRVGTLVSAGLIIGALLITAAPAAADGNKHGRAQVLLEGLSSPKALAIGSSKSVVVGQGAYGPPPGPILEYFFKGSNKGTSTPLTDPVNVADIAMTPDGAGWAIGGDQWIYRMTPDGTITPILNMVAYQAGDLDPYNVAPQDPAETNPYGIAALKTNDVLVADAAGNDIIRVSPDGSAVTVARFTTRLVRTDKVGDPTLPPKLPAEAVPTSIAIGRDGWAYVGQLVGFPGRPGSAKIWRVNPYAEDATCDASAPDPQLQGLEVRASPRSSTSRSTRRTARSTCTRSPRRAGWHSRPASRPVASSRRPSCSRSGVATSHVNSRRASCRSRAASSSRAMARSS